jgi:predicted ribosome quality control (RQC) complex YloA/Tae2 family protein
MTILSAMKRAMSNVDVAAMVEELRDRILGGFVGKAYQQSSDTIYLTVQSPAEGRLDLLLEAGKSVHVTHKERPVTKTPPQFPTMLRSHLSGGRIAEISQHDFDRVMEFAIERSGTREYLIVELFPKGSMVLLDGSRHILTMLRRMIYRGGKMAAGEEYLYHPGQDDPRTVSLKTLAEMLVRSDLDLVRTLVRSLNMGGTYGEEVCLLSGVNKNKPAVDLSMQEIERVHQALHEVFSIDTVEPVIVLKEEKPIDVLPRPLKIYEGLELKHFANFSEALDAFFVEEKEVPKQSPIDRRLEIQRKAIDEFESRERELIRKGEGVFQMYGEIEQLLAVIKHAQEKGYTYSRIWDKISGSAAPQAKMIHSLDISGEMKVVQDGMELKLNAGLTVQQNAQRYYDEAKEMSRKAKGARAALEATRLLKESQAPPKKTKHIIKRRKPKWFERFRWFHSSDGFLVIGGRDADSNEEIYSKYLEKRDRAMHTDAPGAPLTVIKTEGEEVPETTLQEAAQFAVSYSSVWKAGLGSGDCYTVKGDQVTKTPEHGEFLKKGAFVIRGERRYFRDVPVGLALGIADEMLIGGPVSAVKPRADPVLEIEPGEFNADDLAKRIYRLFLEKIEDRSYLKAIASVDQIVQFMPPGGSRIKSQ